MRRVGLSELDQRFSDVAETFNEQREHYEALARCVAHLRQSYGCSHDNALLLSDCVNKIRDEHGLHALQEDTHTHTHTNTRTHTS